MNFVINVSFQIFKHPPDAVQWEWLELCVYFTNIPTAYAILSLEKFVKYYEEPIIWKYLWE